MSSLSSSSIFTIKAADASHRASLQTHVAPIGVAGNVGDGAGQHDGAVGGQLAAFGKGGNYARNQRGGGNRGRGNQRGNGNTHGNRQNRGGANTTSVGRGKPQNGDQKSADDPPEGAYLKQKRTLNL